MLQHVAIGWPNARNTLRPAILLLYVAFRDVAIVWLGLQALISGHFKKLDLTLKDTCKRL